jgi:hypothetical protein
MGYAAFRGKNFSRALSLALRGVGTGAGGLKAQKRGIVHGASLTHFLIFCNRLFESFAEVGRI